MIEEMPRLSPAWLALREAPDGAARAGELAALVRHHLGSTHPIVIHDLGCGTGSMGRWLAPRLAGAQHWILYDRDEDLLERAAADMLDKAVDGAQITVETRPGDATWLTPADLSGASLLTASALLDLLRADEVERVVSACVGAGCPALLSLSVTGRVRLHPAEPLDAEIEAAFNAHQRRFVGDRRLLGPDAVQVAVDAFGRAGAATVVRPSPWRLGPDEADLIAAWFAGWVGAAREQRPDLAERASAYERRRLAELARGALTVEVAHEDLFARPVPGGRVD